jgi:hypothetical protein
MTTTTTRTFEKIDDIFNCKLLLEDGTEFAIPLREDGYIYATGLCKAVSKRMYDWLRLRETKNLIKTINDKSDAGIPVSQLLEVYRGNTSKYSQGTWIHPDLGLNLAQWCSSDFSAQVSKWLRELIFTGKVELGNEKSNEEIDAKYQELIKEFKQTKNKLEETEKKLEETEDLVKSYDQTNKELSTKYRIVRLNHQAYLRHKELYKLNTGPCVYIIDMKKTHDDEDSQRYKIGQTGDITSRVSGFRTSNPFCKVLMVLYTSNNIDLERSMKNRYDKQLQPNNSEFVTGVQKETLMKDLIALADILNFDYTIETEEELTKFNRHIIPVNEVEEVKEDVITPTGFKRCGGLHHKTDESRQQPVSNFFKNKTHKDGLARLCKECYLIGVYGDNRKQRKVVAIPKHDISTTKWCNLCESVKEHKEFYPDKMKKDGLNANCKSCKNAQKEKYREKKRAQKAEETAKNPPQVTPEVKDAVKQIEAKNPLERYSKVELIHLCKEKGITVSIKKTKPEMIKMLS